MSEKKNDGGPAFPLPPGVIIEPGMTLRDYFAGQALLQNGNWSDDFYSTAKRCWAIADAMIAEREKP